ncbi:MAG: BRCT domain-containing protein [Sarcina sp.]
MENMILIDLETLDFSVHSGGIYEVGAIAVSNYEIIDTLHLGIVEDPEKIHLGYGHGYEEISYNENMKQLFFDFISKYQFPLVAHNAGFDKKFLTHFKWLDDDTIFYDSMRAIRYSRPDLPSYSITNLIIESQISTVQSHTALGDVQTLLEILKFFKPTEWVKIGDKKPKHLAQTTQLTNIKEDFEVIDNIFKGKNIVFTGKSNFSRNELIKLAKKAGAIVTSNSLTKKTEILVVGKDAGSKLKLATERGLTIISIDDFYKLTNDVISKENLCCKNV